MRVVGLGGRGVSVLGQGTWRYGEHRANRSAEIAALQLGLDLGLTTIDTAEMYGDGAAEEIVGAAIAGRRDGVFVVTKVLPQNASYHDTLRAAERSLRRLRIDRIDLYLLHWAGSHPLAETLRAFAELRARNRLGAFGVSNFDTHELAAALALPHGDGIACNQVLYNLGRRGIEHHLLPTCQRLDVLVQAYTPLEPLGGAGRAGLARIAARLGVSAAQLAMAWAIRNPGVQAIAKASTPAHVRENAAAAQLTLSATDLAELDELFPRPAGEVPLETI